MNTQQRQRLIADVRLVCRHCQAVKGARSEEEYRATPACAAPPKEQPMTPLQLEALVTTAYNHLAALHNMLAADAPHARLKQLGVVLQADIARLDDAMRLLNDQPASDAEEREREA